MEWSGVLRQDSCMNRLFQAMLILFSAGFSWLAMMTVHQFGHVLHAWLSGGTVSRVFLHPLTFSRTELSDNPHSGRGRGGSDAAWVTAMAAGRVRTDRVQWGIVALEQIGAILWIGS